MNNKVTPELFKINYSCIPGCFELIPNVFKDRRGGKTFNKLNFDSMGLETGYEDDFYSISAKIVIRGLHYQSPPHDQVKLVYCVNGVVQDVMVDIRKGPLHMGSL